MKRFILCIVFGVVVICDGVSGCDAGVLESRAEMFLRKIARGKTTDQIALKKELTFVRNVGVYDDIDVIKQCSLLESEIREMPEIQGQGSYSAALNSFLSAAISINTDDGCPRKEKVALYLLLEKFLAKLNFFLLERRENAGIISTWQRK
ncbi:MAG: hypothetical protein LBF57_04515 [Holosporaceae bacterium]|jgi:hypothetical protein|nr:hypothetical protein [Holosporaceae bacterium]